MKTKRPMRSRFVAGLIATVLAVSAVPAIAQQDHEHQHESGAPAVANLELDAGRKWVTDASLRDGMADIRAVFDADHPAIHASQQTDAQYDALAGRIEAQVNTIVANCRLPPEADANLHYLIADLSQGVGLMRGQDPARTRHEGAALVHGALRAYGEFFDDPAWSAEPPANH